MKNWITKLAKLKMNSGLNALFKYLFTFLKIFDLKKYHRQSL